MPRTTLLSSPALGIRLDGGQTEYAPGTTVRGCVFRKAPAVSPRAAISISLHGRSKSKMVVNRGNSSTTYRGRFGLVDGALHSQLVYSGPLHIPAGGEEQAWPFEIQIPTCTEQCGLVQAEQEYSYVPIDRPHALPSTYHLEHVGFTGNMQCFIEYALHAELRDTGQKSLDHAATQPLNVQSVDARPPIADFQLRLHRSMESVVSYRLVPAMEAAELTLSQKTKQFFGSSKVPTLQFLLQVTTPAVLQLDHPSPMPFLLRAVPQWDRCSENCPRIPQKVKLLSLSIKIVAQTEIKCEGAFSPHHQDHDTKTDLHIADALGALKEPVFIPCTDKWPPIDIGEVIGLRIGRNGRIGQRFQHLIPASLHPSFTTYNIRHRHYLGWKLEGEVAGKKFDGQGYHEITILAPSDDGRGEAGVPGIRPLATSRTESWMRPPPEEEAGGPVEGQAPPAYGKN